MKLIIVSFLFCLFCSLNTYAIDTLTNTNWRHSVNFSFAVAHISQNFTFAYMPYYKNHSLRLGLRINVSNYDYYMNSASNTVYYQRGFAKTFGQKFGLNVGYQYNFKLKKMPHFMPYIFYDFEAAKLALRTKIFEYVAADSLGFEYYSKNPAEFEAGWSYLNTIGFGTKWVITKNINFDVCVGFGFAIQKFSGKGIYLNTGTIISGSISYNPFLQNFDWEMVGLDGLPMIRVGLTYTFAKK